MFTIPYAENKNAVQRSLNGNGARAPFFIFGQYFRLTVAFGCRRGSSADNLPAVARRDASRLPHFRPQAATPQPATDHLGRRQRGIGQQAHQRRARFAQFDAPQARRPYLELTADQFVQTHAPGHQVPARHGQIDRPPLLGAEALDLLRFDQRDALPRVGLLPVAPVADNAHAGFEHGLLALDLKTALLRAYEDFLDAHSSSHVTPWPAPKPGWPACACLPNDNHPVRRFRGSPGDRGSARRP